MQARFFTVRKRRNSTKRGTGGATYDIILKEGCSVINPVIMLKWTGSGSPTAYNGMFCEAWDRYYWIDNWTYTDRQWVASCSVDVLASYKETIGLSSKLILRAASDQNYHVLDSKYPAITPPTIIKHAIVLEGWAPQSPTAYDTGTFVVGLVGQGNTFASGGIVYVQMSRAEFETMISNAFARSLLEWNSMQPTSDFGDALKAFGQNLLKSVSNPFDYINSVRWFPFAFNTSGSGTVKLGRIDTGATAHTISAPLISTNAFISWTDSDLWDWEKIEPFCYYRLVMPPFGTFMLDSREIGLSGGADIFVWTDAISGQATLQVTPAVGTDTVVLGTAQIGIPIAIAGIQNDLSNLVTTASSVAQAASGIPTAVTGALDGILSAVGGGWSHVVSGGAGGGLAAVTDDKALYRIKYSHTPLDPDELGNPLCQIDTINSYTGFVQCASGDIEILGTAGEADQISAFLTGGFFYE